MIIWRPEASQEPSVEPTQESAVRFSSLSSQVVKILADRIYNGVYAPGSQLPPENQLAEEFGVSRATIRSAFAGLAERDLIVRRQGIGTFVSTLSAIINPLNQYIDLRQRIADYGFVPGLEQPRAELQPAGEHVARLLSVPEGSSILFIEKVFTADDKPVIFIRNHIPEWVFAGHLAREEVVAPGLSEPFFDFFKTLCRKPVRYYTSILHAELANDCDLPPALAFPDPCKPILVLDDVGYDYEDRPVFYSIEHHFTSALKLEIATRVEIA
jgi:GntR family transcriptional regulator